MTELVQSGIIADFRVLAPAAAVFALATVALIVRRAANRTAERDDLPPT